MCLLFPPVTPKGSLASCLRPRFGWIAVVAAGMPGCREIISDGQSGYIIDVGSADQLANRILRLLDTP